MTYFSRSTRALAVDLISHINEVHDSMDITNPQDLQLALLQLDDLVHGLDTGVYNYEAEKSRLLFIAATCEFCGILGALDIV